MDTFHSAALIIFIPTVIKALCGMKVSVSCHICKRGFASAALCLVCACDATVFNYTITELFF